LCLRIISTAILKVVTELYSPASAKQKFLRKACQVGMSTVAITNVGDIQNAIHRQ